ncbi:MAG: thioredoxin family protein [Cyclobacteriaceae bacterium]|nr:MAG: thioredoxin family protein [Cyclobacteriaceae bacterium]
MLRALCCGLILNSWITVSAQSYQGLEAVNLVNVINGDSIALDHKTSGPLVVVIFTSNTCPYSTKYENRIIDLYNDFSKRDVQLFLVNPNGGEEDNVEKMREKANTASFPFPYLKDHEQVLTQIFGVTRTPEAYLLRPESTGFELVYRGPIDDNPQTGMDVDRNYLRTAIENSLKGNPVPNTAGRVTGCLIKN